MDGSFYEQLKNCADREEVRAVALAAFGLKFPVKQKFDATAQVLYVFRKERKFSGERGIASPLAQALYGLRELKYGDETGPLPPYVCAVCKGEAFLAESKRFSAFYARRKREKYDWDRTPLSPCPKLIEALAEGDALSKIRVYKLKEISEEVAFFAALSRARAVQLSLFRREKKKIDENNFLKVYEYWASLFAESIGDGGGRKLAEYFLADIEEGKTRSRGGRVEFSFGVGEEAERTAKSLPVYEYTYFWSIYERVKGVETIFAIRRKIDRLSEDFARRFEGEFYTPVPFAAKAYEYLEKTIGKKKLESGRYRIWDMAAGSGNLEFTLPSAALPYTYISTLSEDDAAYCRRIFPSAEVFQYDYLNDDVAEKFGKTSDGAAKQESESRLKMPQKLADDLKNPKLRWLIFINPPFATSNRSAFSAGKTSKTGVSDTEIRKLMLQEGAGETGRELFSQFLFRIAKEFGGKRAYLGLFSTLKYLNAPNDGKLREKFFRYTAQRGFLFSSENFEGSKGKFPVAFVVWKMDELRSVDSQRLTFDVYNRDAEKVGVKRVYTADRGTPLSGWVRRPPTKFVFPPFTGATHVCEKNADVRDRVAEGFLCSLMCCGNDFQHQNQTALFSGPQASAGSYSVTAENFERSMAVHAVRRLPKATWSNNRDQFYAPAVEPSGDFYVDCAVWSAFSDSNNTVSLPSVAYKGKTYRVRNNLFPFRASEVGEWVREGGKIPLSPAGEGEAFFASWLSEREIPTEAARVIAAARAFYRWCFVHGKAEIRDVGYIQLKSAIAGKEKENDGGRALLNELKKAHKALGAAILPRAYAYGFIPADAEYFKEGE